ncbi:MAG TPA: helix-turn-helix transcriptional regulator [Rhodocyclaceae bacterium]|nr:helix-turn-helix transcriptional regulator [Rhodocyclaceae bacterium]
MSASWRSFDPDRSTSPAIALRVEVAEHESEAPVHQHRKSQLVLALHGGVVCEVPGAVWVVPPNCAVWVPSGMPHSNRATPNARICLLFVEPGAVALPDTCCTLAISPLVRELIQHLAGLPHDYAPDSATGRIARVLLDELPNMPVERLHLPTSSEPRIRRIADALIRDPADRSTLPEWARRVALSERSLARLMRRETGLSFGRWRQQLQLLIALRELAAGASVQQVSAALGYESVTAFIIMFRKALGQPPTKYLASLTRERGPSALAHEADAVDGLETGVLRP